MGRRKVKPFISSDESRHYRLVHRSQRDPLQADEEASKMVLQAVPKSANQIKSRMWQQSQGESDDDDEAGARFLDPVSFTEKHYVEGDGPDYEGAQDGDDEDLDDDDEEEDFEDEEGWEDEDGQPVDGEEEGWETDDGEEQQEQQQEQRFGKKPVSAPSSAKKPDSKAVDEDKIGQAALYGVFLDDREYDYTKHLKPIGEHGDAVFVPAKGSTTSAKKSGGALEFRDLMNDSADQKKSVRFELPKEVLPSAQEEEIGLLNRAAENKNLLLEVEPSVREVLYALDDEAYIDEELDDDFFGMLDSDKLDIAEEEEGLEEPEEEDGVWADVEKFKRQGEAGAAQQQQQRRRPVAGSDDDEEEDFDEEQGSEEGYDSDERDEGLSKFSMTSSALFRNKHLTLLDDRFDKMLKDEYDDEDEDEFDADDDDEEEERDNAEPRTVRPGGEVVWTKEQMAEHILSQFLDETSLQGRSLIPSDNPMDELQAVRQDLKSVLRERDFTLVADGPTSANYVSSDSEEEEDRKWDVETVLTTYSNIYNHPAVLDASTRARRAKENGQRIEVDSNGIPISWKEEERRKKEAKMMNGTAPAAEAEEPEERVNKGAKRTKGETKEEKKARKEAVKEERRAARQEKKDLKVAYAAEKGKLVRGAKMRETAQGRIHID